MQEVEDLYLPYRPKRQTRAKKAREKGLDPLAVLMLESQDIEGDVHEIASGYIDPEKEVFTVDDALAGARDIVAEIIMEDAKVRLWQGLFSASTGFWSDSCQARGWLCVRV